MVPKRLKINWLYIYYYNSFIYIDTIKPDGGRGSGASPLLVRSPGRLVVCHVLVALIAMFYIY